MSSVRQSIQGWVVRGLLALGVYAFSLGPVLWLCKTLRRLMPGHSLEMMLIPYYPLLIVCWVDPTRMTLRLMSMYLNLWNVEFPGTV